MASTAVKCNRLLKTYFDALPERAGMNGVVVRYCTMHSVSAMLWTNTNLGILI